MAGRPLHAAPPLPSESGQRPGRRWAPGPGDGAGGVGGRALGFPTGPDFAALAVAAVLTALRLWLCAQTPVLPNMGRIQDEGLFLREAASLLNGGWLGADPSKAMAKAPGFALFLALSRLLGLSYQVSIGLVFVGVALLVARALRPAVPTPWVRCLVYDVILCSPPLFCTHALAYVYRNLLSAALALAIVGCYLALWLRRRDGRVAPGWYVGLSLCAAAFSIVNESLLWLVPFAIAASVAIVCLGRRGVARAWALLAPFGASALAILAVCLANLGAYGLFATNVKYQTSFAEASSDLAAMDGLSPYAPFETANAWVTRQELDRAMEVSPTLATLREPLGVYLHRWTDSDVNDLPGDIYQWCLMDAYFASGEPADLPSFEAFWARVHDELAAAYADGSLVRSPGITLMAGMPPLDGSQIGGWAAAGASALLSVLDGSLLGQGILDWEAYGYQWLSGTEEEQWLAQAVLNGPMVSWNATDGPYLPLSWERFAIGVDDGAVAVWAWLSPLLSLAAVAGLVAVAVLGARGDRRCREMLLPLLGIAVLVVELSFAVSLFFNFLGADLFDYLLPALGLWWLGLAAVGALLLERALAAGSARGRPRGSAPRHGPESEGDGFGAAPTSTRAGRRSAPSRWRR